MDVLKIKLKEDDNAERVCPGTIVALHGHHFDPGPWEKKNLKLYYYGETTEWDSEQFGEKRQGWVQVEVVANGDYTVSRLDNVAVNNIEYDIIIHYSELEVIVPCGKKSYKVLGDDYGLNPMRWFDTDELGFHSVKSDL